MDERNVVLKVKCVEPNGEIVRVVRLCELTVDKLGYFYSKLKDFEVLFNDHIGNSFEGFVNTFLQQDSAGNPQPKGIIYEVDDVGILYLTQMIPGIEALAHYTFWDQRIRGREQLLREMLQYAFNKFGFHRIRTEVALMAHPAIKAVERTGFVWEGRAREATMYKGNWVDVNLYSVLDHEIEELVENGEQGREYSARKRRNTSRRRPR